MKTVALFDAKARLSELVDQVRTGGETIVICKRDKAVVALVEVERLRRLEQLEDQVKSARLRQALEGKTYPLRQVLADLGL